MVNISTKISRVNISEPIYGQVVMWRDAPVVFIRLNRNVAHIVLEGEPGDIMKVPKEEVHRAAIRPLFITYPRVLGNRAVWWVWKHLLCPLGIHLWDEVVGAGVQYLYCDACGDMVPVSPEYERAEVDFW